MRLSRERPEIGQQNAAKACWRTLSPLAIDCLHDIATGISDISARQIRVPFQSPSQAPLHFVRLDFTAILACLGRYWAGTRMKIETTWNNNICCVEVVACGITQRQEPCAHQKNVIVQTHPKFRYPKWRRPSHLEYLGIRTQRVARARWTQPSNQISQHIVAVLGSCFHEGWRKETLKTHGG